MNAVTLSLSVRYSEYSYSSDSDNDTCSYDKNGISVVTLQIPLVPLIAHLAQVLEPCYHITVLPGLPISVNETQKVQDCRR